MTVIDLVYNVGFYCTIVFVLMCVVMFANSIDMNWTIFILSGLGMAVGWAGFLYLKYNPTAIVANAVSDMTLSQ